MGEDTDLLNSTGNVSLNKQVIYSPEGANYENEIIYLCACAKPLSKPMLEYC